MEDTMHRHPRQQPDNTDPSQEGAAYWITVYIILASMLIGSAIRHHVHAARVRRHVMARMRARENVPVLHRIHLLDQEIAIQKATLSADGLDRRRRDRHEARMNILTQQRGMAVRMLLAPPNDPIAAIYRAMCSNGDLAALDQLERGPIWLDAGHCVDL